MKILCVIAFLFLAGCASSVDPNGAYNGNVYLYNAESSVVKTYQTFDTFLKFEYDNRAALQSVSPKIKEFADYVRANAPTWKKTFNALDAAYKANPTQENKDKVENMLMLLKATLVQVTAYLATPVKPTP